MSKRRIYWGVLALLLCGSAYGQQDSLQNGVWKIKVNEHGQLYSLSIKDEAGWSAIPVMTDTLRGMSWYCMQDKKAMAVSLRAAGNMTYTGETEQVQLSLRYELRERQLRVIATAHNTGQQAFRPEKLGLQTGISHYMAGYPQWNSIYFPTMLRCEQTHFGGYFSTPTGRLLLVASPDPVASWSMQYNFGYGSKDFFFWGHRIYTTNLDLLNTAPLPARHPALHALAPGETRSWMIILQGTTVLDDVPSQLALLTEAPAFNISQTTLEAGQVFTFHVSGQSLRSVTVETPAGKKEVLPVAGAIRYLPADGPGVYTLTAVNKQGKTTAAAISVRQPWSWYLQQARLAALRYTQKASWNCENWYGFYSAYLAAQYFPDAALLKQTDQRFDTVMHLMYDKRWQPVENQHRIQNHTTTIGILVDRYRATGDSNSLVAAATLADWVIMHAQSADGAYRNRGTHYTSVIYIAKSIMELMAAERSLPGWEDRYRRHYTSVQKAVTQLMGGLGGLDTEGELTLEDGMISCTALQIGAFALLQEDVARRRPYVDTLEQLLSIHNCLTQLVKPDSRQRGGTLRFWEAQYDVMLAHNMFSSPHGWSAWRAYATWYAYLLTGKEVWLTQTMNALGAGVQLIDARTGDLRWAFVVDPYVRTLQSDANFPNTSADRYNNNQFKTEEGKYRPVVVGEQYVPMVSDWFSANSSDNDVHEIFKCMEEVALTAAYVLEREDGTVVSYNCKVDMNNGIMEVDAAEAVVSKVHVNLRHDRAVRVKWKDGNVTSSKTKAGMRWIPKKLRDGSNHPA